MSSLLRNWQLPPLPPAAPANLLTSFLHALPGPSTKVTNVQAYLGVPSRGSEQGKRNDLGWGSKLLFSGSWPSTHAMGVCCVPVDTVAG